MGAMGITVVVVPMPSSSTARHSLKRPVAIGASEKLQLIIFNPDLRHFPNTFVPVSTISGFESQP